MAPFPLRAGTVDIQKILQPPQVLALIGTGILKQLTNGPLLLFCECVPGDAVFEPKFFFVAVVHRSAGFRAALRPRIEPIQNVFLFLLGERRKLFHHLYFGFELGHRIKQAVKRLRTNDPGNAVRFAADDDRMHHRANIALRQLNQGLSRRQADLELLVATKQDDMGGAAKVRFSVFRHQNRPAKMFKRKFPDLRFHELNWGIADGSQQLMDLALNVFYRLLPLYLLERILRETGKSVIHSLQKCRRKAFRLGSRTISHFSIVILSHSNFSSCQLTF